MAATIQGRRPKVAAPAVAEGDTIQIDLAAGHIRHRDREYRFPQMPDSIRELLQQGGLAAYLKAQIEKQASK